MTLVIIFISVAVITLYVYRRILRIKRVNEFERTRNAIMDNIIPFKPSIIVPTRGADKLHETEMERVRVIMESVYIAYGFTKLSKEVKEFNLEYPTYADFFYTHLLYDNKTTPIEYLLELDKSFKFLETEDYKELVTIYENLTSGKYGLVTKKTKDTEYPFSGNNFIVFIKGKYKRKQSNSYEWFEPN